MSVVHPAVQWAQRKDVVYVTINVQDCINPKVKLEKPEGSEASILKFSGTLQENQPVDVQLELNGEADSNQTKMSATDRHIVVVIKKTKEGFWPRLTKDKAPRFVSVDWSKWVDEDEDDEPPPLDMGQFENLGDMDSDDEEEEEEEEEEEGDQGKEEKTNGTN